MSSPRKGQKSPTRKKLGRFDKAKYFKSFYPKLLIYFKDSLG